MIYMKKREKRFTMLIKRYSIRGNKASKRDTIIKDIIEEYFSMQERPASLMFQEELIKYFKLQV